MTRNNALALALLIGVFMTSCTSESVEDTAELHNIEATEGEDGQVEQDPDAD